MTDKQYTIKYLARIFKKNKTTINRALNKKGFTYKSIGAKAMRVYNYKAYQYLRNLYNNKELNQLDVENDSQRVKSNQENEKKEKNSNNQTVKIAIDALQKQLRVKDTQIQGYEKQLQTKDQQINTKNRQIENTQKLLDQSHQLQGDLQKKLGEKNNNLLAEKENVQKKNTPIKHWWRKIFR